MGARLYYIYIDDSESAYPIPAITSANDITPPAWNQSKNGWYNGNDRCIGVVWAYEFEKIGEFSITPDEKYIYRYTIFQKTIASPMGDIKYEVITKNYIPANAKQVLVNQRIDGSGSVRSTVSIGNETSGYNHAIFCVGYEVAVSELWIDIFKECTRNLYYTCSTYPYVTAFRLCIKGYQIDR